MILITFGAKPFRDPTYRGPVSCDPNFALSVIDVDSAWPPPPGSTPGEIPKPRRDISHSRV